MKPKPILSKYEPALFYSKNACIILNCILLNHYYCYRSQRQAVYIL